MASRKSNPDCVVTSAAYLLFYRRRSSVPLGGPFFEQIIDPAVNADEEPETESSSRAESPSTRAGEGQRLDGSSRNGSSSALPAAAVHHAGDGGLEGMSLMDAGIRSRDPSPPRYSVEPYDGEQSWPLQALKAPPASEGGSEDGDGVADDMSTKAVSSAGTSDGDDDLRSERSLRHSYRLGGDDVPSLLGYDEQLRMAAKLADTEAEVEAEAEAEAEFEPVLEGEENLDRAHDASAGENTPV